MPAAVGVEFKTSIAQDPANIGELAAILAPLALCILNVQFLMVLLLQPSPAFNLKKATPNSILAGLVVFPSVKVNPSSVT